MYIQIKYKKLGGTKLIKLRIGKEEIVYSDDDLSAMTRNQLKQLKQDLQCNMKDREHWLWSFYINVKHNIDKSEFEKFVKMTDENIKYHIEIGE